MRALIVSAYPPPVSGQAVNGGYRRFAMFVRAISEITDEIELLHFLPPLDEATLASAEPPTDTPITLWDVPVTVTPVRRAKRKETLWVHYGAGLFSIFNQPEYFSFCSSAQIEALSACLNRKPDLIFVAGLASMSPFLRLARQLPPIFFDINDVDHRLMIRTIFTRPFWFGKFMSFLQIPALVLAERRCIQISTNSFVCSDLDLEHLRLLDTDDRLAVVPNAITMPRDMPSQPADPTLLFLGFFGYAPNAIAADRLIQRIFPLIRQKLPSAQLIIAGKLPQRIASFGTSPEGVEFAGFVDDLDELYYRSRAICCPMINGGGTRVKLIEAAGYAKPIVSTSIGAEGLSLVDGEEILIRENDDAMATACVQLLTDAEFRSRLGNAARRKVQSLYDIDHIRSKISKMMQHTFLHSGAEASSGKSLT